MGAAVSSAAAGGPGGAADDFSRVYHAVASGASKAELRRVIEECAQGDDQRRAQAVNHSSTATETPLQAAHRQKRGDLVGALVEAGADVGGIFNGKLTPLAVCIAYGQVDSVRALLRASHEAKEKIEWDSWNSIGDEFSTPAHFCFAPPPLGLPSDRVVNIYTRFGAPQIGCLEVLLREGGAEVESRDSHGYTPIFWLTHFGLSYDDEEEKARARPARLGGRAHLGRLYQQQRFVAADDGGRVQERPLRALSDRGGGSARVRAQPKRRPHRAAPVP